MNILVTGGAGFIGRWVTKKLLENNKVVVLDNLSNSSVENISEFLKDPDFNFIKGDILDTKTLNDAVKNIDLCIHLAAQTNVQESLDYPEKAFKNNVIGTYNILEVCRKYNRKLVLVGTCMVYDLAISKPINEEHPIKPLSPYASSKLAAEILALSYYYAYNLPVMILRPFNVYGPFQKTNMEGGVVSIFIQRNLNGQDLNVFGDGTQTRDFMYVEDCVDFIVKAAFSDKVNGEIINAGSGKDISIKDLALLISKDPKKLKFVPHHHPQAEIQKMVCDYSKAEKLLDWEPKTSLERGVKKTTEWIKAQVKK